MMMQNRRLWLFMLIVGAVFLLFSCHGDLPQDGLTAETDPAGVQRGSEAETETDYSIEGVLFRFGGRVFDITERCPSINALMACKAVGKYLVIEGHVGPKNGVYSIFNTEAETFEKDIMGCNLIWRGDDISTAVYSFWEGIYTYDGERIADISLEQPAEFIWELAFISETELLVTVSTEGGYRTETVSLIRTDE